MDIYRDFSGLSESEWNGKISNQSFTNVFCTSTKVRHKTQTHLLPPTNGGFNILSACSLPGQPLVFPYLDFLHISQVSFTSLDIPGIDTLNGMGIFSLYMDMWRFTSD